MVFIGVRVFLAAAGVGLLGLVALIGWEAGKPGMAGTVPHSKISSFTLSVLPMFILIGYLAFHAGPTQAVFDAAESGVARRRGGLAIATVFAPLDSPPCLGRQPRQPPCSLEWRFPRCSDMATIGGWLPEWWRLEVRWHLLNFPPGDSCDLRHHCRRVRWPKFLLAGFFPGHYLGGHLCRINFCTSYLEP
ncbi:MAG: hypothetical protein CM1200mP41_37270 [Gammaproteobacteria bacterium]|nr:MAG: hypothetical protein CM1200mP41_37270 [Gammaproteobacteria bacterium]